MGIIGIYRFFSWTRCNKRAVNLQGSCPVLFVLLLCKLLRRTVARKGSS